MVSKRATTRPVARQMVLAAASTIQNGITNVGLCLETDHKCRTAQLLESEMPRLKEILLLGGHAALP